MFKSNWKSLPDMTYHRSHHACSRIKRSGRDYIVAVCGIYLDGIHGQGTSTIEFYDLTLMPASWEFLPGIVLPGTAGPMLGGIITAFDEGICEAFFINGNGQGYVCTGNYSWTANNVVPFRGGILYFPVIDANLVGGDNVW